MQWWKVGKWSSPPQKKSRFLLNRQDENVWFRSYTVFAWLKNHHLIWKLKDKFTTTKDKITGIGSALFQYKRLNEITVQGHEWMRGSTLDYFYNLLHAAIVFSKKEFASKSLISLK